MAVALEHVSWVPAILHHDVVCQIAEEERSAGKPVYLAFLYDEIVRRQIASRAPKSDPDLDIMEALGRRDKQVLEVARTRLESALRAAGIMNDKRLPLGAGDRMQSMAQSAAGLLQANQQQLVGAAGHGSSRSSASSSKKLSPKEPEEPPSKRKLKKQAWWSDKMAKHAGKKRKRGW